MKDGKRLLAVMLAASVAAVNYTVPAWALAGPGGPGTEGQIPDEYDAETWARLNDNVLEYEELANLIHSFNPNAVDVNKSYDETIQDYSNIINAANRSASDLNDELKEMKRTGNYGSDYVEKMTEYTILKATADSLYKQAVQPLQRVNSSGVRGIKHLENSLTNGAQQIMIYYSMAAVQKESAEKLKELNTAAYEAARVQLQNGSATQADLLSAQTGVLSAETTLAGLEQQMDSLRRSLCLMTGWSADALPDIRPLPPADISRIASINLAEDTAKAIGNNYELQGDRHSAGGSTTNTNRKMRTVSEGEQKLSIQMEAMYKDILQKKTSYDAAVTAFENASLAQSAAETMYQTGGISRLQYLGKQMAYLGAKASKQAADIALLQSIQAYDWAIEGIVTIE